jgi:hypothetical protein
MAISKNKSDIIDNIILKELPNDIYWWFDDSDDWDYWYYYNERDYDWDYEDVDIIKFDYIHKSRGRVSKVSYIMGKKIDMMSAYSKQYLRELKLDALLSDKKLPGEKTYLIDNLDEKSLDNLNKFYYLCNNF